MVLLMTYDTKYETGYGEEDEEFWNNYTDLGYHFNSENDLRELDLEKDELISLAYMWKCKRILYEINRKKEFDKFFRFIFIPILLIAISGIGWGIRNLY